MSTYLDEDGTEQEKPEIPSPHRFIGKDVIAVSHRFKELQINYRITKKNGLLTADYNPERYTIVYDENDIIVDCYLG